jgi:hypothetical protein
MAEIRPKTLRNRSDVSEAEGARPSIADEISWRAVLVGVVVALVTQLFLSMLEVGAGVGSPAQAAAPAQSRVAVPFPWIEQSVRGGTSKEMTSLRDAAVTAIWAALHSNPQQAQEARERAAQAVAQAQQVSVEQARTQVQLYEQQHRKALDQAKQQAIEAADTGAKAVSRGALFGSIGLLLGAVAGWLGGYMGAPAAPTARPQARG